MAFRYTVKERKTMTKDGNREPRQIATQVNLGKVTIHQLAKEIADITSLGRGDVASVLTHLSELAIRYSTLGFSVDLGDLGTLTPRLSAKALPLTEKYTPDAIRQVRLRFTPSKEMKIRLKEVSFEKADPAKDAKCPNPSAHTTPKTTDPGEESGSKEIG